MTYYARAVLIVLICSFLAVPNSVYSQKESREASALRERSLIIAELWQLALARVVAFQPSRVGVEKFVSTFNLDKNLRFPEDRTSLRSLRRMKRFSLLQIVGNELLIGEGAAALRLGLKNLETSEFTLNGHAFTLDAKQSLREQLRKILATGANKKRVANSAAIVDQLLDWLVPAAQAKLQDEIYVDGPLVTLNAVVGALYGATYALIPTAGAAIAGGATIGIGATLGVAAAGATGGAALAMAGGCAIGVKFWNVFDPQPYDYWSEFHNCMASPLTLIGMNYRDRLYLKEINCATGRDSIDVVLTSPSGIRMHRNFYLRREGRSLERIELDPPSGYAKTTLFLDDSSSRLDRAESYQLRDDGRRYRYRRMSRPAQAEMLDKAQDLLRDYEYYYQLCLNPERVAQVRAAIARGERGHRAADIPNTGEFHRSGN